MKDVIIKDCEHYNAFRLYETNVTMDNITIIMSEKEENVEKESMMLFF